MLQILLSERKTLAFKVNHLANFESPARVFQAVLEDLGAYLLQPGCRVQGFRFESFNGDPVRNTRQASATLIRSVQHNSGSGVQGLGATRGSCKGNVECLDFKVREQRRRGYTGDSYRVILRFQKHVLGNDFKP